MSEFVGVCVSLTEQFPLLSMFGLGLGLGGKYGICIAGVRVCRCMCVVDRIVSTPVYVWVRVRVRR